MRGADCGRHAEYVLSVDFFLFCSVEGEFLIVGSRVGLSFALRGIMAGDTSATWLEVMFYAA